MSFGLLFSQLKTANLQSTRISHGCSCLFMGVNYSSYLYSRCLAVPQLKIKYE